MNSVDREAFLRIIEANEDDETARQIYADWLDDCGEHEEADRQRKWCAAKNRLIAFCEKHNDDPRYETTQYDFTKLIELLSNAAERISGYMWDNDGIADGINDNRDVVWRDWAIITGKTPPSEAIDGTINFDPCC